jgi:excisionase family DNA binding protein
MGQQRKGRDAATIPPGREYLSLREFANYVGIPFKTLEGWKAKGYLPRHFVFGKRHYKWKRSEIDA